MADADEKTVRATKDELVSGLAEVHCHCGDGIPNVRAIEDFVDPILGKVLQQDPEAEITRPAPQPKRGDFVPGEWYGEPDHSPQIGVRRGERMTVEAPNEGEKLRVFAKEIGTYALGVKHAVPLGGSPAGAPEIDDHPVNCFCGPCQFSRKVRSLIRELWTLPEWRKRISTIVMSNMNKAERGKALTKLLSDAVRVFGDPIPVAEKQVRDRKVIVT